MKTKKFYFFIFILLYLVQADLFAQSLAQHPIQINTKNLTSKNCTVQSDLEACTVEKNFGYIYLDCEPGTTFEWSFPSNSPAFEKKGEGSTTILKAGQGTYSVTITNSDGSSAVETYEIEANCCIEKFRCLAPKGLSCSGNSTNAELSWNPVPGAISYYVTITPNSLPCCGGNNTISTVYQPTTNTFQNIEGYACFTWTVTANCKDRSATSALVCYRDGKCTYFSEDDDQEGFRSPNLTPKVYPNPSSEVLNFELKAPKALTLSVEIYSLDGKLVKSFSEETHPDGFYQKNWSIDQQLTDGLYFILFKTNYGTFHEKVVISKESDNRQ